MCFLNGAGGANKLALFLLVYQRFQFSVLKKEASFFEVNMPIQYLKFGGGAGAEGKFPMQKMGNMFNESSGKGDSFRNVVRKDERKIVSLRVTEC